MNSITKRWVRGSLTFIVGVLLIAEVAIVLLTANFYYSGARQAMLNRITTLSGQLANTTATEAEYEDALRRMVGEFSETDKFELMLVDVRGQVVATSSGFVLQEVQLEDYEEATLSSTGVGEFIGPLGQESRVMAITLLVTRPAGEIAALRIVTSVAALDERIVSAGVLTSLIMLLVLFAAVLSGWYFIRSIVNPVAKIEATATRIAAGDFDVRVEAVGNDEIARLCNTINEMATELAKTEQMKNEFISSVSHELRTPLTAIKGWAETLAKVPPQDENYKRGIGVITSETDRLYAMVEELLDFSRMQNGGLTLEKEKLDAVAEVSDAVLMFRQRALEEGKILAFEEPETFCPILADKNRLRQVLVNILDNALKYTPPNGEVLVKLEKTGAFVHISIKDSGPGILQEDIENVKTKFYKGKNAARGSGIGLAVADEIIAAHEGKLALQSEGENGTTVNIYLPLNIKQL